jgi:hypothetical protein
MIKLSILLILIFSGDIFAGNLKSVAGEFSTAAKNNSDTLVVNSSVHFGSIVSVRHRPQLGSENFKINRVKAAVNYNHLIKVLDHTT